MKLSEAIELLKSNGEVAGYTTVVNTALVIINYQRELLEEAKLFIEIKPNTPSETIYLHDKFNILYKLTEAEI